MGEPQDLADKFVSQIEKVGMRVGNLGEKIGNHLVCGFDLVALFVIGGTIVWSAVYAYIGMVEQGYAGIKDILLLVIYLELGAMVGIHFKTRRLPVEFLLYVAITALTRLLVIELKAMPDLRILVISGAIMVIALAVRVLHIGRSRFPTAEPL